MMAKEETKPQSKYTRDMPVQFLKGVGPAKAKIFEGMGVRVVGDLLEYFPRDWKFVPEPVKINELILGHNFTVIGQIEAIDYHVYRKSPIFEARIADDSGVCRVIWFHGGFLRNQLKIGGVLVVSGEVSLYKHQLQFTNPQYIIIDGESENVAKNFSGGVYPATGRLSSRQIKHIIRPLLGDLDGLVDELYSDFFLKDAQLVSREKAFRWIHLPCDHEQLAKAKQRLKYDELFLMQLGLALRRYRTKHFSVATKMVSSSEIDKRIRKRFPFLLTEDQNKAVEEIVFDMTKDKPMNRLLQGDVGSGKTVVALYAGLLAVANKKQVAIMAPTEILADQHFISIERYLKDSDVKRVLITGGLVGKKRKEVLNQIKQGQVDIVVGTVALLQRDIEFNSLGLVIIDEQHKFGVEQRGKLRKRSMPHCLVMTATPIPRTLAMTAFGDLDVSIIKHCPPGRGEVITRWVDRVDRQKAEEFIRQCLKAKRQAYFVYPRITAVEQQQDVKAATEEYKRLGGEVFPEFKVELIHGQMPSDKKAKIMDEFRRGKIDILVSTVVIEVGVDVPNATIMVVEEADRFGLAQLHQLRGRIGRGQAKSHCFLFAETQGGTAESRLNIMTRSNDGFEIAEYDLKIRGPGELFSTRQHGLPDLKIANIVDDYDILVTARKNAFKLAEDDPMLIQPSHRNIRKALLAKFGDSLGLAGVA
jgi:ATP-dependent DNA helicase RecG